MNCHQESIGDIAITGGPASSYFPWARMVRLDDTPLPQWNTSQTSANSLTQMRKRHNYYRNDTSPFFICQDFHESWGQAGHAVDHVRDQLSLGTIDLLLSPNEPDGNANISPTAYANWAKEIKRYAVQMVPNVLLGGPQLSTWSLGPNDQRTWLQTFIDEGGLDALDVFCIHPYCQSQDPRIAIPGFITDLLPRIRGKPLVFTEMGIQSHFCDLRFNDHSAAHMAQGMADYVTGCGDYPCILYDGPYGLNGGGYGLIATIQFPGATSTIQTVDSTVKMAAGMQVVFQRTMVGNYAMRSVTSVLSSTTFQVDAAVATQTNDLVVDLDYNASMSYWTSTGWQSGFSGQTPMGSNLAPLLPAR